MDEFKPADKSNSMAVELRNATQSPEVAEKVRNIVCLLDRLGTGALQRAVDNIDKIPPAKCANIALSAAGYALKIMQLMREVENEKPTTGTSRLQARVVRDDP